MSIRFIDNPANKVCQSNSYHLVARCIDSRSDLYAQLAHFSFELTGNRSTLLFTKSILKSLYLLNLNIHA